MKKTNDAGSVIPKEMPFYTKSLKRKPNQKVLQTLAIIDQSTRFKHIPFVINIFIFIYYLIYQFFTLA